MLKLQLLTFAGRGICVSLALVIFLKDDDLIGKGMMRSCYQHPDSLGKCIKIFHKKIRLKTHAKEVKEMRRLLRRRGHSLIVPQYFGTVETNKGTGFVFELIKGANGSAPTLRDYLEKNGEDLPAIKRKVYEALFQSTAIFTDLNCGNVLVLEEPDEVKFAVIDGLGERAWFKICSLSPYFARKKLKRKWSGMAEEMDQIGGGFVDGANDREEA